MKKIKNILIMSILSMLIIFAIVVIHNGSIIKNFDPNVNMEIKDFEEDVSYDFSDNKVIITMTKDATNKFLDYSVMDFSEVNAIAVDDLTSYTVDWVREKTFGIETQEDMYVDVEKFRRILSIELPEHSKENVINAIKILKLREDIENAEVNALFKISGSVSDDARSKQWGLDHIDINNAWDVSTGSSNVYVAVLDSGISAYHNDLKNRIATSSVHRNFTKTSGTAVGSPSDDNGHGTMVAGIIGAEANNGGIAGVTQDVRLASVQVIREDGTGSLEYVAQGVSFCQSKNIPIINFSGGKFGTSTSLYSAIASYKGLFITAAGNYDKDIDNYNEYNEQFLPAAYKLDNIITVGAIDKNNNKINMTGGESPDGSNYGKISVDLFAPGSDIYSTFKNYQYMSGRGTSFAAPFVTGVAALMLAHNPDLTAAEIKAAILNNVTKVDSLKELCVTGGVLNAEKALKSIGYKIEIKSDDSVRIAGTYFNPQEKLNIPSTINGHLVTGIGYKAFANSVIQGVSIPSSVNEILFGAFQNCSNLLSISLPSALTYIDQKVFYECSSLQSVTMSNKLTRISSWAFYNCSNLSTLNFNSDGSLEHIGGYAFSGCAKLKNFNAPSVRQIGVHAFSYSGLTSVYISQSLEELDEYAFYNCENLTTVTSDEECSLTAIGAHAFEDCNQLTEVKLPYYIYLDYNVIGEKAFANCVKLNSINLPSCLVKIENSAFYNTGLKSITIPQVCTEIGEYAFANNGYLETINLPIVDNYGDYILASCPQLTTINLYTKPTKNSYFSSNKIFCDINSINGVTLNITNNVEYDSIHKIPSCLFYGAESIKKVVFSPMYEVQIDSSAFGNCVNLKSVDLGDKYIMGKNVFSGCSSLTEILGTNVVNNCVVVPIDENSYKVVTGCKASEIPTTVNGKPVVEIADYAFYGMSGIKSISIPESIKSIGAYAFMGYMPDYMEILGSVKDGLKVDDLLFGGYLWDDLIPFEIIVADKETYDAFCNQFRGYMIILQRLYYDGLKYTLESDGTYSVAPRTSSAVRADIVIPYTHLGIPVTKIYAGAFADCEGLKSVILPSTIKEVGEDAFNGVTIYTDVASAPMAWNNIAEGNYVFWRSTLNNDDPFLRVGSVVIRSDIVEAIEAGLIYDPVMRFTERYNWMVYIDELGWETYSSLTDLVNNHCPTGNETIRIYSSYFECMMPIEL